MQVMRGPNDNEADKARRSVSVLRHYARDLEKGRITDSDLPHMVEQAADRVERLLQLLRDIRDADCENGLLIPQDVRIRIVEAVGTGGDES